MYVCKEGEMLYTEGIPSSKHADKSLVRWSRHTYNYYYIYVLCINGCVCTSYDHRVVHIHVHYMYIIQNIT